MGEINNLVTNDICNLSCTYVSYEACVCLLDVCLSPGPFMFGRGMFGCLCVCLLDCCLLM